MQASIAGLREGLVDTSEGDPQLMPPPGAAIARIKEVKAKVMRENSLGAGAGAGASKGGKGSGGRARLEADGVTAR